VSSLHVNVRFASAFILPLVVVGAFLIDRSVAARAKSVLFPIASLLTIAALLPYFFLSRELHSREFKVPASQEIQNVGGFNVLRISEVSDWDVFKEHASSYRPYEPLFGYSLETFKPLVHPGSVFEEADGYFNMTNPSSLVFPELNKTNIYERIRTDEREKLEAFIQYKQPDWSIPVLQKLLDTISLITFIIILCVLILASAQRRHHNNRLLA
jgi:hypothetical protein